MGTEDWILKSTKLIAKTKKQRLKIQSRGQILKNTILKTKNKQQQTNKQITQSHRNYNIYIYIYMKFALKIGSFFFLAR